MTRTYRITLTELEAQLVAGVARFNVTGSDKSHAALWRNIGCRLEARGVRGWEEAIGRLNYPDPDELPGLISPEVQ